MSRDRCGQGWGYWKYPDIPNIDTWKWLDSRRMTNVCERWALDHTNALQGAWFNGVGFETWENGAPLGPPPPSALCALP